jgi:presequence protease
MNITGDDMNSDKMPDLLFTDRQYTNGFEIREITKLPKIKSIAYLMVHKKSGAKLIYLNANDDDDENLFSAAFKTPPFDDTGLPHILEHTVLCGSKRYPVKDPFVELLKSSLATFLNAMTYPDKTVYPCASMNEEDFHNILRVYCDAVFFPNITEEHFKQEGHHLEFSDFDNTKSDLTIKGIVYNEMKGVYSDLNGIIDREESKSLLPDNAYGKDSGGNPDNIPELTYENFVKFHSKYYHPSNAYIFIYGSFDIDKTLKIINEEYLTKFDRINLDTSIKFQKRFEKPVYKTIPYPISESEDLKNQSAVTINFLTNDVTDTITTLAMSLLEVYLLDNSSSPLRKALIDSKLGEALTSSGYADYQRDTFFTVGLRNIDEKNVDKIIKLIRDTCKGVINKGIDKSRIESAFHRLIFNSKEIQSSYPLVLMDRIYNYWLYGKDPITLLKINQHLDELKKLYKSDDKFFEKIIEEQIINNKHYSVLTFLPDNQYYTKKEQEFQKVMTSLKSKMTESKLNEILAESKKLQKMHLTSNTPEALATLPKLPISAVNRKPQKLDEEIEYVKGNPIIYTDVYSNDINYINIAFDLSNIDNSLINYVSIFRTALLRMGAAGYTYDEMAEREAEATGGFSSSLLADGNFDDPLTYSPYLMISSKSLNSNLEKMLSIIIDRIISCDFKNIKRLKDILLQKRAALRGSILSSGSSYAMLYAAKDLNINHNVAERFSGITQLRFLNKIIENFDKEKDLLINNLIKIQKHILSTNKIVTSFVGAPKEKQIVNNWLENFTNNFSADKNIKNRLNIDTNKLKQTGIIIPTNIAFNAIAYPSIGATNKNAPALLLLSQYLTYDYLWEEIRSKKGAYGVKASYSTLGGMFGISTYRDPCIGESFNTFNTIFDYIENKADLGKDKIEQAIIGSIKKLDKPVRPSDACCISIIRHLRNIKYNHREVFRENLLNLTGDKIKDTTLNYLKDESKNSSICSISDKNNLEKANTDFDLKLSIENLLD